MEWKLEEALAYYKTQGAPGDQTALIALLREIQSENGGAVPRSALYAVTEAYRIKEGILMALIRRIPSLRLSDVHVLELCAGPNCGRHTALADYAEKLKKEAGFTLKYVPCMRQCGKGPNIRWDGKVHNRVTEDVLKELVSK